MKCLICNQDFKLKRSLSYHLTCKHKDISKQEYYDKYLKKDEKDGFCKICNKKLKLTKDFNYRTYCSSKCVNNDIDIRQKIENTNLQKFGFKNNTQSDYYKKLNSNIWKSKTKEEINKIREKNKETCLEKYGVDNPSKLDTVKQKIIETNLEKYGVEHVLQNENIKEKGRKTCLEKYGVDNIRKSKTHIEKWVNKKGFILDEKYKSDYYKYYRKVFNLTIKNKSLLLESWDGYDYYDNDFIQNNFELNSNDKNYPTIDHKISIFYGFNNNIPYIEISNINNLCITKRSNNSKKGRKIKWT